MLCASSTLQCHFGFSFNLSNVYVQDKQLLSLKLTKQYQKLWVSTLKEAPPFYKLLPSNKRYRFYYKILKFNGFSLLLHWNKCCHLLSEQLKVLKWNNHHGALIRGNTGGVPLSKLDVQQCVYYKYLDGSLSKTLRRSNRSITFSERKFLQGNKLTHDN